jgi:hypothetical protein
VTHLHERDDGKDVRLTLRDETEIRLRFGGPTTRALVALRQELTKRGVARDVFFRDQAER